MDTNLEDIALWGRDKLKESHKRLVDEGQDLMRQIPQYAKHWFETDFNLIKSSVFLPASSQVMDAAVLLSTHNLYRVANEREDSRASFRKQLQRHSDEFDAVVERLKLLGEGDRSENCVKEYLQKPEDPLMPVDISRLHQIHLHDLIKHHSEDMKLWFDAKYLRPFRQHLTVRKVEKRSVVFEQRQRPESLHVPAEIMLMVYGYADAESCVALREVSIGWYMLFKEIAEAKLKSRDPLFTPNRVIQTWADCLLVYSHRLKTWPSTTSVDKIEVPKKLRDDRFLIGTELKADEPLPLTCRELVDDNISHLIHLNEENEDLYQDPWTLLWRKGYYDYETVLSDDTQTVIRCELIEITLPPGVRLMTYTPSNPTQYPVKIGGCSITVLLEDTSKWVLPRNKPHFEHGRWFPSYELVSEKGPLVVCTTAEEKEYEFFDLATGKSVKYPATDTGKPAAFNNGLTWWLADTCLIPVFYDLGTQRVHYNPNKVIDTGECTLNYNQCSVKKGFGNLVRSGKHKMVDLDNGTVTTVESYRGIRSFDTLWGYYQGEIRAWCIANKDVGVGS